MKKWVLLLLFLMGCSEDKNESLSGRNFRIQMNDMDITLSFKTHENRYFGKAVNRYFGEYRQMGDSITFQTLASEMYSGPEEDMETENFYFQKLKEVNSFRVQNNQLVLRTKKGDEFVFHPSP